MENFFQIRQHKFRAVFIDTFYEASNPKEKDEFVKNTQLLWNFSVEADPFECKDVKTALNDLMEARKNITSLVDELEEKEEEILSKLETCPTDTSDILLLLRSSFPFQRPRRSFVLCPSV